MLLLLDQASKKGSVARLASVPHGDSVLALGDWGSVNGPPIIPPMWSLPSDQDPSHLRPYGSASTMEFDPKRPQATLDREIATQHILHTTFINVATAGGGGILNTPFVDREARAAQFAGSFWIETIEDPARGVTASNNCNTHRRRSSNFQMDRARLPDAGRTSI